MRLIPLLATDEVESEPSGDANAVLRYKTMKRIFTKHGEKSSTVRIEPGVGDSRKRRQRGVIMMLTALMITVMIGFLSLSIDLGFAFSSRNQFQNGLDSAALAGAAALR